MHIPLLLLLLLLECVMSSHATAQIVCAPFGKSVYCQDGRHDTLIAPMTPSSGAIMRDGQIEPYAILPSQRYRDPGNAIEPLEELPSLKYDRYDSRPRRNAYDDLPLPGDGLLGGW